MKAVNISIRMFDPNRTLEQRPIIREFKYKEDAEKFASNCQKNITDAINNGAAVAIADDYGNFHTFNGKYIESTEICIVGFDEFKIKPTKTPEEIIEEVGM